MAVKSTVIYDRLFPTMYRNLSQPKNQAALKSVFNEMISRNSEALASAIPDKPVYMDNRSEKKYYEVIGVSSQEIIKAVQDAPYISDDWLTVKNPMYISLMVAVFVFKSLKKTDMMNQCMFLCSLYMYRNVRSKYFSKVSQSTINVMNYTISRLSYKSDLKKYGSILKMIGKKNEVFMNNWFEGRKKDVEGIVTDEIICKMVNDNHRRYSTALNVFYADFKQDSLAGNYINTDKDVDNEDEYMASDNTSFAVEKSTQALMGKFSLSRYPDGVIIKHACTIESGCSTNNLRNVMNYIYDSQDKELEEMIRIILQTFLFEMKHPIDKVKSYDFLIEMRGFYKKQTTQNPNLNKLKELIDKFIVGSGITKKIKRTPTINDCKKAVLLYVLLFIQRNI